MSRKYEDGYAVVEPINIAAVRTGRMISQYKGGTDKLENGMILQINHAEEEVSKPASEDYATGVFGLHWSEERLYKNALGRKDFVLDPTVDTPRVLILEEADRFETNAVDDGGINFDDAVYGVPHSSGLIELKEGTLDLDNYSVVLEIVKEVDLPNEGKGIRFAVLKA